MIHKRKQTGFTLMELLISMAISVIALTAAVLLMTKFARNVGAYSEVAMMEEARGSSETLLRADFDGAGLNLTRPSAPGAGQEAMQFFPNPEFNTSGAGSLSKLTNNSSYPNAFAYSARAVTLGLGLWGWTYTPICKGCWCYVVGNEGNFDALGVYYDENGSSSLTLYESSNPDAGTVASSYGVGVPVPTHVPGDIYQIGVEAPNAQQTTRFVRYYRIRNGVRTILYTSTVPVPAYPLYFMAYQPYTGGGLNNVSVIAAPIENRANNQTESAILPFDGGTQLTGPVTITNAGASAIILSGDKTADVAPTLTTFNSASTQLDLKTPARGSYTSGDALLLVDYGSTDPVNPVSPASAVCVVSDVATVDSQTTRLTLTRARQTNPAWGRLWSSDTNFAHTFTAGAASVVKLAPPITYTISTDNRLVRVEGARASTLAFNARQATFTQTISPPYNTFSVSITLAAEGFETNNTSSNETRATIEFVSTPRALNLASNQLN